MKQFRILSAVPAMAWSSRIHVHMIHIFIIIHILWHMILFQQMVHRIRDQLTDHGEHRNPDDQADKAEQTSTYKDCNNDHKAGKSGGIT